MNKMVNSEFGKRCFSSPKCALVACLWIACAPFGNSLAADASKKPAWLTDLSLGVKQSYDDNILLVSGNGLRPESSWITTVSPRLGFNFVPLLGGQKIFQTLSLVYSPDFAVYENAASESYNAHRIASVIKGKSGNFSFALDNGLLINDGNKVAPTYALNQLSGALANQNDKYRSFYAQAVPRERRDQIQDRASVWLRYDWGKLFVRPTASLLDYDLNTTWQNTGVAPYKGYQDWPDRSDVNGGADLGYTVVPKLAVTLGYRYGHQYQQRFPATITADSHYSSSDYQRVLLGLEGNPWSWLNVKLAGGPDFRQYNANAPVNDLHPAKYYGEAVITATITTNQSVVFNYKQWQWVSSTGLVPYFDSTFTLGYHWNVTRKLGLDLGGKILEADFTSGNEITGSAPSRRDDRQYTFSTGVSYAFDSHFSASVTYAYDFAGNVLANLPATYAPSYRNFDHQLISVGVQCKF